MGAANYIEISLGLYYIHFLINTDVYTFLFMQTAAKIFLLLVSKLQYIFSSNMHRNELLF